MPSSLRPGASGKPDEIVPSVEMTGVGPLTLDEDSGCYISGPVTASALSGAVGQVVVADHLADEENESVHAAVAAFLTNDDSALRAAGADVFAYYVDTVRQAREEGWDSDLPDIAEPEQVWDHVSLGHEFYVDREAGTNGPVYVSIECECAWEPEHGLQLVFRGGHTITKVGPFDGHLTNTSAFGREDLAGLVYVSPFIL